MNRAEEFERRICNQAIRQDLRGKSVRAAVFTGSAAAGDFVLRLGSGAILARLILPEHFGLVMMVLAFTGVADHLRELGLSFATIQERGITHGQVTNLFWINTLAGLGIAGVICGCSPLISAYYRDSRLIAITCLLATNYFFGGLTVQHEALLTRQLKLGHTAIVRLLASVVSTLFAVVLAFKGFGCWALVWREVSRSILAAAGMWLCFPWIPGLPSRKANVRRLLGFGTNLTLANVLATLSEGVDRLIIGRVWGAAPIGIYRQAFQLIAVPTDQVPTMIYCTVQPGLCALQADASRFQRYYQRGLAAVCIIVMPISLFVALYSTEVTRVMLGPRWAASAPILMILSFGTLIKQPITSAAWVLISCGRAKTYLALTMAQNVTVILFMLVGVRWGINGVAVAYVAATYFLIWPKLHYSLKGSPISMRAFLTPLLRPAVASAVMALALVILRFATPGQSTIPALAIGTLTGLAVFCVTWLLMPGGKAEVSSAIHDLRSALRTTGKTPKLSPAEIPAEG
ncbi:MAG: lipopolysaccharide biosynthesis protein [Verrucomicrobiota bacterium]|jgi:PST family polysaccharide transporter